VLDVNLGGTMLVTRSLLSDLESTRGTIVNIVSIMATIAYQPNASAYAASKAALLQWTRSLAVELAPRRPCA
jgi:3-oxoacyl-[acyl-carrier protein] reductase